MDRLQQPQEQIPKIARRRVLWPIWPGDLYESGIDHSSLEFGQSTLDVGINGRRRHSKLLGHDPRAEFFQSIRVEDVQRDINNLHRRKVGAFAGPPP